MLSRLFPRALDNAYQGSRVAVWLLAPVLLAKTLMGFNFSGLNPIVDVSEILQTVDGVPLSTFSQEAAATVIDSAAAWGVALFALCLFVWLILIRYRAGLPAAILMLVVEQVGRTGADTFRIAREFAAGSASPTMGAWINLGMTTLLVISLALSLLKVRDRAVA
ncbi:MAG: hypothetical protein JNL81_10535 [Hyphomonadaceae bacterium]|nr:hypothetical protein [Hyphomonadaceae bacterium]